MEVVVSRLVQAVSGSQAVNASSGSNSNHIEVLFFIVSSISLVGRGGCRWCCCG